SPLTSDTYTLFDVFTPISSLEATGTNQTGIYADLGSGTSYGSTTVNSSSNGQTVSVPLNSAGISNLNFNVGTQVALGGALTTVSGSNTDFLFANTSGSSSRQLAVTLAGADSDFYSFTLNAGQRLTAALKNLTGSGVTLTLQDSGGNTVATGTAGASN